MVLVLPEYDTAQVAFTHPPFVPEAEKLAEPPPKVLVPLPLLPLAIKQSVSGQPLSLMVTVPPSRPAPVAVLMVRKVATPVVALAANDRITKYTPTAAAAKATKAMVISEPLGREDTSPPPEL